MKRDACVNEKKLAVSNYVASLISYAAIILVGLLEHRFLPLYYGSEMNGLVGSVGQFIEYLWLFEAGVGATTVQALYRPVALNDKDGINSIINASGRFYSKSGLYYLICLIILSVGYPFVFKSDLDRLTVAFVVFLSGFSNVINFWVQEKYSMLLKAEGKSYIISNLLTYSMILSGIVRVLLMLVKMNILYVVGAAFLIRLSSTVFLYMYIRRNYKWLNRSIKPNYESINQRGYAFVKELSRLLFNGADIIIISFFCGLKVVSVYSMYKVITNQMNNLIGASPTSIEFSQGQLFQTDKRLFSKRIDLYESLFSTVYHTLYSVTLFMFVPFMKLYTEGINDINYVDYRLALLFVVLELLHMSRSLMSQTINVAGHFRLTTPQTIAETFINICVSVIAVQFWGIYGALIGTIIALLYRANDMIIYANKRIIGRSPAKTYLIHLINLVLLIVFQFIYRLMFVEIENYGTFMLYGAIMVVMTGAVMLSVQVVLFPDFRYALFGFVSKALKMEKKA